jgi:catechol 2,3-dioxygenase-like lactoylglutathione lyase family enzyme
MAVVDLLNVGCWHKLLDQGISMQNVNSFYPVLAVRDPRAAADFFTEHLGFVETFATDWYVSLRRDVHEVAFLSYTHTTLPEGFRTPVSGILLNVEVDDAAAEYARLAERAEVPVRLPLRDEEFGQRHFIMEAPEGILVDVIEVIDPSPAFLAAYQTDGEEN